jgi:hypothetical protein
MGGFEGLLTLPCASPSTWPGSPPPPRNGSGGSCSGWPSRVRSTSVSTRSPLYRPARLASAPCHRARGTTAAEGSSGDGTSKTAGTEAGAFRVAQPETARSVEPAPDPTGETVEGNAGSTAPTAGGRLCVTFLDVGQGSSALLKLPNGATVLIDGAARGRARERRGSSAPRGLAAGRSAAGERAASTPVPRPSPPPRSP